MRISELSSDVCSSDLRAGRAPGPWRRILHHKRGRSLLFAPARWPQRTYGQPDLDRVGTLIQPLLLAAHGKPQTARSRSCQVTIPTTRSSASTTGRHDTSASSRRRAATSTATSARVVTGRSEEHTSDLHSLIRISYAVVCVKKKTHQ